MAKKDLNKPSLEAEKDLQRQDVVKRFEAILAEEQLMTEKDKNPPYLTLRKVWYRGRPVYIRKLGYCFSYMLVHNNDIFTNHVFVEPEDDKLTANEVIKVAFILLCAAETTIDTLMGDLPQGKNTSPEYEAAIEQLLNTKTKAQA